MLTEDEELPDQARGGGAAAVHCVCWLWIGFLCSFRTQEEVEVEKPQACRCNSCETSKQPSTCRAVPGMARRRQCRGPSAPCVDNFF